MPIRRISAVERKQRTRIEHRIRQRQRRVFWIVTAVALFVFPTWLVFFHTYDDNLPSHRPHIDSSSLEPTRKGDRTVHIDKQDTRVLPFRPASVPSPACPSSYDGILLIQQGDREGAAGTIFFLFVLNQILYADKYNLLPWVHLNDYSQYVYDDKVHSKTTNETVSSLELWTGVDIERNFIQAPTRRGSLRNFTFPGQPRLVALQDKQNWKKRNVVVRGNGVWSSYFEPLEPSAANTTTCLPLVKLSKQHIIPGLHIHSPWSVRSWRYTALLQPLQLKHLSFRSWIEPMRVQAHAVVEKYYRFRPYIRERANRANPVLPEERCSSCLAIHIRHSDKANGRLKIPVGQFLPYVRGYVDTFKLESTCSSESSPIVYLATDSLLVLEEIQSTWPRDIQQTIRSQHDIVRSNSTRAVFQQTVSHHRTNTEVLTDILAMSYCDFMIHGMSAVSEASIYLNLDLHNQSINLDDPGDCVSAKVFRGMVKRGIDHNLQQI